MAVIGLEFGRAGLCSIIVIMCSIAAVQLTDSKSELVQKEAAAYQVQASKLNLTKTINDIYNIISKSTKSLNKSGYIIQAKSDPKRLILITEQQAKPPVVPLQVPPIDVVTHDVDDEQSDVQNINLHLHLTDAESPPKSKTDYSVVGYAVRGRRWKRSSGVTNAELETSPDALQAMKRVIFIRCPFYSCPQGHICDYQTRSCRPVFYPDMDYD